MNDRANTMEKKLRRIHPIFVMLLFPLMVVGCELIDPNPGPDPISGIDGGNDQIPADTTPATVERGINLYAQYCARCHGDDALGTPVWPASIRGKQGIAYLVQHGRGGMPSFPNLSDSAVRSIELYLMSFGVAIDTTNGEALYTFYCAGCHGPEAEGAEPFPGSIRSFSPIHDVVRNGQGEMPAIDIPDDQIAEIQEYLLSFNVDFSKLTGREYYSYVCAGCHGAEGEGTLRGPEIRNPVTGYATWVVRHGRPGVPYFTDEMPKYDDDSLSQTQLNEIIAWLRSAPKPADGRALYNRFCANCHGTDAGGGPVGKGIRGNGEGDFIEKVREGEGGRNYGERDDYMPSWSSSELTDAEIRKMAQYVRTLR